MEAPIPTPARTSLAEIVNAGLRIVEADGLDGLTMQRVAAPSASSRRPSTSASTAATS